MSAAPTRARHQGDAGGLRNPEPDLPKGEAQPSVDIGSTQAQPTEIQDPVLGRAGAWIHGKFNERNFPVVHRVKEGSCQIGLANMVYNICRYSQVIRLGRIRPV